MSRICLAVRREGFEAKGAAEAYSLSHRSTQPEGKRTARRARVSLCFARDTL
jgi:hypothetical protein